MYDIIVIGGGPAGLAASINGKNRNKSVLLCSNDYRDSYLYKAARIENYPGRPGISGKELLEELVNHAKKAEVEFLQEKAFAVISLDGQIYVSAGDKVENARRVILAIGMPSPNKFPGEAPFLGRGVSYCATCDGMLYRNGKKVTVVGKAENSVEEANYLNEIGCQVTFVSDKPAFGLKEGIESVVAKRLEVMGKDAVTALKADDREIPSDGIFILRNSVAPSDLLPGLELDGGAITVNRRMETSVPGVYAAGDCTGRPLQISKSLGEGQSAALNAAESIDLEKKEGKSAR